MVAAPRKAETPPPPLHHEVQEQMPGLRCGINGNIDSDQVVKGTAAAGDTPLRGMKKWLAEYHAKRPGLAILQAKVDAFMADYDAREEKARKDKIAAAEEDGWTVVVGNKGRKKTTDLESGIRAGAVSSAAVAQKVSKQRKKDVVLDFYRFQKRESRRNEVLELQQKFLEDKKRIVKMREARKFRPY